MEEALIYEVEKRPILYDKTLDSYKKLNAREKAWNQVAEILGIREFECRRRWRTLRDSFIKLYRSTKYHSASGDGGRKKQWIYYNQMSFLTPHIDQKQNVETADQERSESGNEEFHVEDTLHQELSAALQGEAYITLLNHDINHSLATTTENHTFKRRKKSAGEPHRRQSDKGFVHDPDEQFMLSCAPTLRRLPHRQNTIAKMKILQVLYELEFESAEQERPSSSASLHSATSQGDCKDWSSLLTPVTLVEDCPEETKPIVNPTT